jgi:type IV pilus assembly protein PilO
VSMESFEKKQYISLTVGMVVVLAIGYLRCKPIVAKAQELRKTKAEQMLAGQDIKNSMNNLPRMGSRMEELQNRIGNYRVKVPEARQFAGLWDQIAAVMKTHELNDQLIQPNEEVVGKEINSISITIRCNGTFQQLFDFINDLEDFERVIRIEQLRLINSNENPGTVTMDAKAKIYYQSPEQEKIKI